MDKIDEELSSINQQEQIKSEARNMEYSKKDTLIEDQNILDLFSQLNKQYPDTEWFGKIIHLPKLDVSRF